MWKVAILWFCTSSLAWGTASPDFNGDGELNVFDVMAVVYCVIGIECPNAVVELEDPQDGDILQYNGETGAWELTQPETALLNDDNSDTSELIMHGDYLIENSVDLAALAGYTEITGDLRIYTEYTGPPSLASLESLTTIGGDLFIYNNYEGITSLEGLENLTDVAGGYIQIMGNQALCQSMVDEFLSMLKSLGWSGTLVISGNDNSC